MSRSHPASDWKSESGQVVILIAGTMATMMIFVGMVLDVGVIFEERRQLQNAVDAAALAAANAAHDDPDDAQAAAEQYLLLNGFDPSDVALTITVDPHYSDEQVEVTVTAIIPTMFFSLAGVDTKTVSVRAVGEAQPVRGSGDYAFAALSETACGALEKAGDSELVINGGGALIPNSSCSNAFWAHGNGSIVSEGNDYFHEGNAQIDGSASVSPAPSAVLNRVDDPLDDLTTPSVGTSPDSAGSSDAPVLLDISGTRTLRPGVFWGGLNVTGDVTLEPGVYVMAGGGIRTAGGGRLQGDGVLIYNTDISDEAPCGAVSLTGANIVELTPMTSGAYAYLTFWQDRDCDEVFSFSGGHSGTTGAIYVPGAHFDMAGGGTLGSIQVFADTIEIRGGVDITMDFVSRIGDLGSPRMVLAE